MNISLAALKEAVEIKERITSLEARLEKILGGDVGGAPLPIPFSEPGKRGQRKMSASARARIGEAKKAWWANQKGRSSVEMPDKKRRGMSAAGRARIAAAQRARWARIKGSSSDGEPGKKKRGITAAGRARLAAAMKARWAARKKGAPALNARKKK